MDISTTSVICINAVLTGLLFIYRYLTKNFGYWESQGIPCEKSYPLFGTEFSMFRKPISETDLKRARKYGKLYGGYILTGRILYVLDPEIIKLIFVKDFHAFVNRQKFESGMKWFDCGLVVAQNDDWKRIRSVVSPTFSSGKLRKMTFLLKNISKKYAENLVQLSKNEKPINIKEEFSKYSVEVIGACVFGMHFDTFANPNHPFLVNSKKLFGGPMIFIILIILSLLPPSINFLKAKMLKAIGFDYFAHVAQQLLDQRRSAQSQKHVDFLQLMIDAKDDKLTDSEMDKDEISDNSFVDHTEKTQHSSWTKTLDEDEIVAQCTTFLLAGHDTVASALAYVAYNLALNPDVQERLLQEIDDAWENHGDIDYDVVNKMPYLHAVISESLRIHTIALRLSRRAKEDYQIPNTNFVIPKDTVINIPIYALHHDPEYFPDPEKFDPDRFLPENKDKIVPYTYMPFADGPRNCVAMRFALINMKVCFAYILRYIKFSPTEETKFIVGSQVLQSKNGIIVRLENRRDSD